MTGCAFVATYARKPHAARDRSGCVDDAPANMPHPRARD
ncbi:hypothetical protein LG3211_1117 [Lysobacter gummosus]|nr:hypothetical protein LG3211_1117 [Lysobacter gummosus]